MLRGAFQFQVTDGGDLTNCAENVEALRRLWLHHSLVAGEDIGPGDRGDFAVGAWHVSCHLAGAAAVRRTRDGTIAWLEISHDPRTDEYYASASIRVESKFMIIRLDSAEGRTLLEKSTLLGFVEGNSTGRTSARGVNDSPDRFNLWRRQDFDQPVNSSADGGKVWEHWCTMRDITVGNRIGTSVLTAYVSLVSCAGDRFVPTVARGRRDYGHPIQLAAMVFAGFTSTRAATWDTTPTVIPSALEPLLLEAQPETSLEAAQRLTWGATPRYYMFARRLKNWSRAKDVHADLKKHLPEFKT
jgi:hypothetical protein